MAFCEVLEETSKAIVLVPKSICPALTKKNTNFWCRYILCWDFNGKPYRPNAVFVICLKDCWSTI